MTVGDLFLPKTYYITYTDWVIIFQQESVILLLRFKTVTNLSGF